VAHVGGIGAHRGLHGQGRVAGAQGVVFVGDGGTEQGHNAIAKHLVDSALEAVHGVHHVVDGGVEELLGGFRIKTTDEFRRVFKIGEQHRDLLALAFEASFGGQDFLGQIWRRIGKGCTRGRWCDRRGRAGLTRPDQHGAILINRQLLDLDDLHLQIVQVGVVQGKLSLEGAIGDPSAALQQLDDLVDHRKEVHYRPSTWASAASAAGSQKVMSMVRYISMAVESSAQAGSRWPIVA
jgi:hypothetical protein